MFGTADIPRDGRVVFDIGGNKYRLVVWINYAYGVVYARFTGTHRDYDKINAQTVRRQEDVMDVRPIRPEADYQAALAEIARLMAAGVGTPTGASGSMF